VETSVGVGDSVVLVGWVNYNRVTFKVNLRESQDRFRVS